MLTRHGRSGAVLTSDLRTKSTSVKKVSSTTVPGVAFGVRFTAINEEVNTIRFGRVLAHDSSTFNVPFIEISSISACFNARG